MVPFQFLSFCTQTGFLLFAKRHLAAPRAVNFSVQVQCGERDASVLEPVIRGQGGVYLCLSPIGPLDAARLSHSGGFRLGSEGVNGGKRGVPRKRSAVTHCRVKSDSLQQLLHSHFVDIHQQN